MEIIHVKCIGKRHSRTSQITNKPELDFFKLVLHRQKNHRPDTNTHACLPKQGKNTFKNIKLEEYQI